MAAGNARHRDDIAQRDPEAQPGPRSDRQRVRDAEMLIIAIGHPPDLAGAACAASSMVPADSWFAYPDSEPGRAALAVCSGCPVRRECLEWALGLPDANGSGGILGGMSQAGLRRERARRKLAAAGDEVA